MGWDGAVKLWDYCTQALLHTYKDHTDSVFAAAFAPGDGRFFASVGVDAQIVLYVAKHEPSAAQVRVKTKVGMPSAPWVKAKNGCKDENKLLPVKVQDQPVVAV